MEKKNNIASKKLEQDWVYSDDITILANIFGYTIYYCTIKYLHIVCCITRMVFTTPEDVDLRNGFQY